MTQDCLGAHMIISVSNALWISLDGSNVHCWTIRARTLSVFQDCKGLPGDQCLLLTVVGADGGGMCVLRLSDAHDVALAVSAPTSQAKKVKGWSMTLCTALWSCALVMINWQRGCQHLPYHWCIKIYENNFKIVVLTLKDVCQSTLRFYFYIAFKQESFCFQLILTS